MSQDNTTESPELVEYTWRGTVRRMYPEVAAYLAAFRQVQWDYEDAIAEAQQVRATAERMAYRAAELAGRSFNQYEHDADRQAYNDWRGTQRAANARAELAKNEATQALRDSLINSPHREVAWIASHCLFNNQGGEVEGYARDILAILPATTEQIWEEAKDNRGMCDVFDRFYNDAEADGIFNGGKKFAAARELAALRSYLRRELYGSTARDIIDRVNRIVKIAEEKHAEEMAAARAEWQGLDEAWRSERSRRAAATRAANREAQAEEHAREDGITETRSVISTQSAMTGEIIRAEYDESGPVQTSESQPEAPKASAQDDFALVNSN